MPFTERVRKYWHSVAENKCQFEYYTESRGWQQCWRKSQHVHHIKPEGLIKYEGGDPDTTTGLPLCDRHHVRNTGEEEHSDDFSFHPDMGKAYENYGFWKSVVKKFGKKAAGPSPFQEAGRQHGFKRIRGERYVAGNEDVDRYYTEKMKSKAIIYQADTGEKRPETNRKQKPKPPPTNWEWSRKLFDK